MRKQYTYVGAIPHNCAWCGKPLVQNRGEDNYKFNRRKTCGNGTECHKKILSQSIRIAARGGVIPCPETGELMWDNPMDEEQHHINKLCAQLDAERMGLAFDKGRTLTKEEITELEASGGITPITQIRTKPKIMWRDSF